MANHVPIAFNTVLLETSASFHGTLALEIQEVFSPPRNNIKMFFSCVQLKFDDKFLNNQLKDGLRWRS